MDASQLALHARMEERHWWFLGRRRILRALLSPLLPPGEERLVVDVGCGTGGNVGALAREYRVVGIDTSETAIELAREKFPGARFWCGKLADLPRQVDAGAELYLLMDVSTCRTTSCCSPPCSPVATRARTSSSPSRHTSISGRGTTRRWATTAATMPSG